MTAIQTEGLTKRYGDCTAVDSLDLTVPEGEVFGFLGPNGAGKSTTINMLLNFIQPSTGEIRVLGYDPRTQTKAVRERIGVLPEGYGLYDRLSARRHLEYVIELGSTGDDVDALLQRVGLADDADRAAGGFSKGMRQRLALAMALVGEPDLLILDEPSSGLDPNGAQRMQRIVREEAERGATVFFSSHIMEQVEAVCDRVGIMNDGEFVAVDTVDALRATTGSASTLVVSVDEVPDTSPVQDIDGVDEVWTDAGQIHVACTDSSVKATVITRIEAAGATVTDIGVEEAGLDDLFSEYTGESTAEVRP